MERCATASRSFSSFSKAPISGLALHKGGWLLGRVCAPAIEMNSDIAHICARKDKVDISSPYDDLQSEFLFRLSATKQYTPNSFFSRVFVERLKPGAYQERLHSTAIRRVLLTWQHRQYECTEVGHIVEDRVGGFRDSGVRAGVLAGVQVAVEAGEVAARYFQPDLVAFEEDV